MPVEIDLLAQPSLGADAEAVTHDQHADDQFRIDRGPADRAVEWRQLLPQRAEVEKPVDLPQQVIDWNPILKAKLIKQLRLVEVDRSRPLRCSPADFRTGSDRARCDGHCTVSLFLVNINP